MSTDSRYFIATWGCQMNVHDSEKLAGALESDGHKPAQSLNDADIILLNTCSIREKAAEKVFSELGRLRPLKKKNPNLLIGVCGCVAQQEGESIYKRAPYVDFVIGPRATGSLPQIVRRLQSSETRPSQEIRTDTEYREDSIRFPFDEIRRQGSESRKAFVTVIEGCNHRCTYCIVPTTRGPEICRSMDEILAEVRALVATGTLEIEYLGQTVNAFRDSSGNTLAELLLRTAEIEGVARIRFTASHPAQMTNAIMDAMRDASPIVCPYLHLPVQSGSSAVLKRMRRGYTREKYLDKIEALRNRIPNLVFGTDIIVGFPGETEAEFEETLTLLDIVRYETCYSFAYSPRPGTASLAMIDSMPIDQKLTRLNILQARQKEIQAERNALYTGRDVRVLVEGRSKRDATKFSGRTPEYRLVNFTGASEAGRMETVRIVAASPFALRGELKVPEPAGVR